ncbi:CLUMA_CG010363, isoform A [Clunio marinus]|uniref:CLUMA_CG010363, isoform A n=1 Tax=Clunio marinus TaxID=568069 RepID=A0A1J1I9Y1_9DIPT|nr:CLUMA_CG010363, isoform A [Clunio marinus]
MVEIEENFKQPQNHHSVRKSTQIPKANTNLFDFPLELVFGFVKVFKLKLFLLILCFGGYQRKITNTVFNHKKLFCLLHLNEKVIDIALNCIDKIRGENSDEYKI